MTTKNKCWLTYKETRGPTTAHPVWEMSLLSGWGLLITKGLRYQLSFEPRTSCIVPRLLSPLTVHASSKIYLFYKKRTFFNLMCVLLPNIHHLNRHFLRAHRQYQSHVLRILAGKLRLPSLRSCDPNQIPRWFCQLGFAESRHHHRSTSFLVSCDHPWRSLR